MAVVLAIMLLCLPCGICFPPRHSPRRRVRDQKEQIKARERNRKAREKNQPRPLGKRRRALSVETKGKTQAQSSRLLQLPLEIREQIYREVLGNSIIHLTQLPKRLGHFRCVHPLDGQGASMYHSQRRCLTARQIPFQKYHYDETVNPKAKSDGCLTLLKACRQVYSEAIQILYSTNIFDVNHAQTLILFARTIRPQQLEAIKHLSISWNAIYFFPDGLAGPGPPNSWPYPDDPSTWQEMWDIVGTSMTGLQHVRLTMHMHVISDRTVPSQAHLRGMLEVPRQRVRGLQSFTLELDDWGFHAEPYAELFNVALLGAAST
ncbi:hypothetical protein G7Y89_g10441 [Cudoniella acicularis]|uniref:DUF7730 domain-containing protein n=1 Tax=Cudoniella acicularis TaxID=354080 RepID=A0A8H4RFH3_9HELO|nr:hypothetical protein G7Y89_g10441 [Cudoniella acicularis]